MAGQLMQKMFLNRLAIAVSVAFCATSAMPVSAQSAGVFELSGINGSNGFVINGVAAGDILGNSVSGAGDVNGDGIADLIVGASGADPNGSQSGASYVVFGSSSALPNPFDLLSLNGVNGFVINGVAVSDQAGRRVSAAGDVNGDGIADLIVGSSSADPNGSNSGASYVVFGSSSGRTTPFNLSSLNGLNGFVINGAAAMDRSGFSVGGAGDVNGDGIDDLVVGAVGADHNGSYSGASYVVFGSSSGLPNPFEVSSINGLNGFVINGAAADDQLGGSARAAGDVNGDGIDDLIVGAVLADPNGSSSGSSYVVFGSSSGLPNPFEVSSLNGLNGFVINGAAADDFSGAVSAAGDVNGDGIDDLIVGASRADPNGGDSGSSYVVFGASSGLPNPFNLSSLNGLNGFVINGAAGGDRLGVSVNAAGDVNGDGIDDVIVGALMADPNGADSGASYVLFGSAGGLPNPFQVSTLNGINGFAINGVSASDFSGISVSAAGDVNGDGIDDLTIGAGGVDTNGGNSGASYVVFGRGPRVFANGFEGTP